MKYIAKRTVTMLITLFMVAVFTFIAFQIIPGDSAMLKLGMDADDEAIAALRESMGLNRNVIVRFFSWLGNAITGDFGISTQYSGTEVSELLAGRMKVTVWLAVLSLIITVVVSIPLGILAARRENGIVDRIVTLSTQTFMAVPPFFLGILITLVFGIILKMFMPGACPEPDSDFGGFIRYLIFPAVAVAVPKIAMTVKFLRSSVLRELSLDYVRTARSKGNTNTAVMMRHVFKNALMPVVTFMGMVIADVLAGSIIIEQVFSLPGMGRSLIISISNRDYAVAQAIIMYIAVVVVIINFIVDILYQRIDPRVRK